MVYDKGIRKKKEKGKPTKHRGLIYHESIIHLLIYQVIHSGVYILLSGNVSELNKKISILDLQNIKN